MAVFDLRFRGNALKIGIAVDIDVKNPTASVAQKMVVKIRATVISCHVVCDGNLQHIALFGQQAQIAIDSGFGNGRMVFLNFGVKHINRRVRISGFKRVQDDLPLDGVALGVDESRLLVDNYYQLQSNIIRYQTLCQALISHKI